MVIVTPTNSPRAGEAYADEDEEDENVLVKI